MAVFSKGDDCSSKTFWMNFTHPTYGNCFTFNANGTDGGVSQQSKTQNISNEKNTKNWYTIDALGAIFAIFIILDKTFTILLQY